MAVSPAPRAGSAKAVAAAPARASGDVDLVRSYLRDIGRVPLLSHQQEITLGRQVQELMELEALEAELRDQRGGEAVPAAELAKAAGLSALQLTRKLQAGRRAKERMVAANLRLVAECCQEVHQAEYGTAGADPGSERSGWCGAWRNSTHRAGLQIQ
jgi:DNA-directed RNA polymerase, sigma subunit (sigma70/sigma32)